MNAKVVGELMEFPGRLLTIYIMTVGDPTRLSRAIQPDYHDAVVELYI